MSIILENALLHLAKSKNAKFDQGANGYFQVPSKWQPASGKPNKSISVAGKTHEKMCSVFCYVRKVTSKRYEGNFIIY